MPDEICAVLFYAGLLDKDRLKSAQDTAARDGLPQNRIPQVIVDSGWATRDAVLQALAKAWYIPVGAAPAPGTPRSEFLSLDLCRKRFVLPLSSDGRRLRVACAEPLDAMAINEIRQLTGLEVEPVLLLAGEIAAALE
ncbi:MAG: hypothetical protein A2X36_16920 [Elusimicrobia bacterium GWA2_69_24]|nr:MAG: hypothetical protein A2X36_16920 [Elusimicrobia bacterium GWA2_69_24]HBL16114.1 hypothetical protein [Elusimicrobiota bacterium]